MKTHYLESGMRIIRLFINNKHVKSFPIMLELYIKGKSMELSEITWDKGKSLTDEDYKKMSGIVFVHMVNDFLLEIKKTEKYLFELIDGKKITGVRLVESRENPNRTEILFEKVAVKCPDYFLKYTPVTLPKAYLNY